MENKYWNVVFNDQTGKYDVYDETGADKIGTADTFEQGVQMTDEYSEKVLGHGS